MSLGLNIHPGFILIIGGLIATVMPEKVRKYLQVIIPAIALYFAFQLKIGVHLTATIFGWYNFHYLSVTNVNYIFLIVFSVMALLGGIYAMHNPSKLEAFASMGYTGSALCVTLAGDWITLLIFWELLAVTSLFLIWSNNTKDSNEAGFRYLLIHMLGGNLILFGVVMEVSRGNYMIGNLSGGAHDLPYWLILIGMAINAAVVPLHAWVPDAYPEGTITGSVFMSSFTTKVAVLCMLRAFAGSELIMWAGVIMIIYGACFAILENDLRRLLSYHIISQVGYMVADIGIGTEFAANGAATLAFAHVLYKSCLFMVAGIIITATGVRKINQLGGLAKKSPLLCICFFIAAFSISGFPPFAGFTCKSLSLVAAEEAGLHAVEWLMLFGSIGTALSIPFKLGYYVFIRKENTPAKLNPVPKNMYVALVLDAGLCVLFGVVPSLVYNIMPYAQDYSAYTAHHLLEYMQFVPAAFLAFLIYLSHMEPHYGVLTLDMDWIARKPFKALILLLVKAFNRLQRGMDNNGHRFQDALAKFAKDPMNYLFHKKSIIIQRNEVDTSDSGRYNEDVYRQPIGYGMVWILVAFIVIAVWILN